MEIHCTVGQVIDDCIMRPMRIARWITNATGIHLEYVILIAFPQQKWVHESPQCYVTRALLDCSFCIVSV